ncbi:MAG TPA: hypothetical protein VF520_10125 [Thermoleophilaceae bacterium]
MRLRALDVEHSLPKKLLHRLIRRMSGSSVPDVVLTLHHRPKLFGNAFSAWVESSQRGPSTWTQAEREVMASFVSARNHCVF